jgi:hypothetical protein
MKSARGKLEVFYGRYVAVIFQFGHRLKLIMALSSDSNSFGPLGTDHQGKLKQSIAHFWLFRAPASELSGNIRHHFFMQDFQG